MYKNILCVLLSIAIIAGGISSFPAVALSWTLEEKTTMLNQLGLFFGTGNGYELDGQVTRAQAVTMVLRYVGVMTLEYNSAAAVFEDVPENHWADGNIGKAVKLNIAKGTSEKTFEPEEPVTAPEFVTFMLRAIGYSGVDLENCIELALECGVLAQDTLQPADAGFNRGDMVAVCWQTLDAKRVNGMSVWKFLGFFALDSYVFSDESVISDESIISDEFEFNLSLLKKIESSDDGKEKNFMFSPFSIKMAFMMAANGAEGETGDEILKAFGISDLNKYNETAQKTIEAAKENEEFKLNIANSIWFNSDYYKTPSTQFTDTYKQAISKYYYAEARETDNANAVKTINDWVSENTNEKIKNVISDPNFLAALINTIYFKADWTLQFKKESTVKADFTDKNKKIAQTDFMQQTAYFEYFENERMQMLNMPYRGSDISMYVFLPKKDAEITSSDLSFAIHSKDTQEVYVKMPKYKTEFSIILNNIMKELGVKKAFDSSCMDFRDVMFSGVPAGDSVYIDLVIHKSFIEVDEKGTEAAAATVISMVAESIAPDLKPEPKQFIADHPFVYVIRDNTSGEVLFMGQYAYVE